MADRRLPFMDGLVLAIAADEKTVTRRIVKGLDDSADPDVAWSTFPVRPPYGAGDTLLVCEALVIGAPSESTPFDWVSYRADGLPAFRDMGTFPMQVGIREHIPVTYYEPLPWGWKVNVLAARYCPTWAVRHRRRIVSVTPERLSSVTDAEAVREGVARLGWTPTREGFIAGFRRLHELSDDADPWVWRIEWASALLPDQPPRSPARVTCGAS